MGGGGSDDLGVGFRFVVVQYTFMIFSGLNDKVIVRK